MDNFDKQIIFSVDIPQGDSGLFINVLKYTSLFILIWWFSWILIFLKSINQNSFFIFFLDHIYLTNTFLTLAIFSFFIVRIRKKYKYGDPFELIIDDNQELLEVKVKNTFDDTIQIKRIPYQNLLIQIEIKDYKKTRLRELVETQKIIRIKNNYKLETSINIEMSAWCRHPEIDKIIDLLKSRSKNNRF